MLGQAQRLTELVKKEKTKSFTEKKILAVTSGKGGTGKSFFVLNYAFQLSQMGKRVLLIDLDYNLANIDVMLNMSSEKTLSNFFESRVLFRELIKEVRPNLDLIFGDSGKLKQALQRTDIIDYLFTNIKNISDSYDYILVDTGAGISRENLYMLSKTDYLIMLINPDPTSVMDGYALTKVYKNEFGNREIGVIVNKCDNEAEGKLAFENINKATAHFLKVNLNYSGYINFHNDVYKSIKEQIVFSEEFPESEICFQIKQIAQNLTEKKKQFN